MVCGERIIRLDKSRAGLSAKREERIVSMIKCCLLKLLPFCGVYCTYGEDIVIV